MVKSKYKNTWIAGMNSSQACELDLTYQNRFGDVKLPEAIQ